MYNGLLHLHSLLRWIILVLLIVTILRALGGMLGKKPFTSGQRKLGLFTMIAAHITLLIGLYQYFAGTKGLAYIKEFGMGEVMKSAALRFWAIEHFLGMLIAIVLVTLLNRVGKSASADEAKQKRIFWLGLIALIVIIASVPWPFREGIGRPLFPGMTV
jgi:hypothetical protein